MKNIFDKIWRGILKTLDVFYVAYIRLAVKNKDFSIISNNCWAGRIYNDLNLPYNTPTVGLFFFAEDYIKFITKLKYYLSEELSFTSISRYEIANKYRSVNNSAYPIGILDDIEIHFLHYKTDEEAFTKWNKRKARVRFDNLYLKMCDQNLCTENDIQRFDKLPYKNKVFFSSKDIRGISCLVYLNKYKNEPHVGDLYTERWQYRLRFNIAKWLNT